MTHLADHVLVRLQEVAVIVDYEHDGHAEGPANGMPA
jgi:hypothetical protein